MSELILVVEDDKNISDLLEIYLKNEGYDVIATCSTEEAMESYVKKKFDLAIIDVMLPGKDGFYLCRELRKHHNFPIITQDDVKAKFENGVLTLEVPKKEEAPKVEEKKYISIEG